MSTTLDAVRILLLGMTSAQLQLVVQAAQTQLAPPASSSAPLIAPPASPVQASSSAAPASLSHAAAQSFVAPASQAVSAAFLFQPSLPTAAASMLQASSHAAPLLFQPSLPAAAARRVARSRSAQRFQPAEIPTGPLSFRDTPAEAPMRLLSFRDATAGTSIGPLSFRDTTRAQPASSLGAAERSAWLQAGRDVQHQWRQFRSQHARSASGLNVSFMRRSADDVEKVATHFCGAFVPTLVEEGDDVDPVPVPLTLEEEMDLEDDHQERSGRQMEHQMDCTTMIGEESAPWARLRRMAAESAAAIMLIDSTPFARVADTPEMVASDSVVQTYEPRDANWRAFADPLPPGPMYERFERQYRRTVLRGAEDPEEQIMWRRDPRLSLDARVAFGSLAAYKQLWLSECHPTHELDSYQLRYIWLRLPALARSVWRDMDPAEAARLLEVLAERC